ncbi:hypothetical protein KI387_007241, partial [Taxus chinensis]
VSGNAILAIMTVVVVFEFTAGATLSKGLNRGIGTVVACSLAVCVGYIAGKAGCTVEYFKGSHYCGTDERDSERIVEGYKDVLDSKASEESLVHVNFHKIFNLTGKLNMKSTESIWSQSINTLIVSGKLCEVGDE